MKILIILAIDLVRKFYRKCSELRTTNLGATPGSAITFCIKLFSRVSSPFSSQTCHATYCNRKNVCLFRVQRRSKYIKEVYCVLYWRVKSTAGRESEVRSQDITLPCVPSHGTMYIGVGESFSNTTMYQHRK